MRAYPLKSISIEQAKKKQFDLVDSITREFDGYSILTTGDLGVHPKLNQPLYTRKVEKVMSRFFKVEDTCFVRSSGTGSIREALAAVIKPGQKILIHSSPIYSTTMTSFKMMGLKPVKADFNNLESIKESISKNPDIKAALIQYTRQSIDDSYRIEDVISTIRKHNPKISIVTDDNYAVMKVEKTGAELGADLSCFSLFKLLGPPGIGLIIGKKDFIEKIRKFHYSGGTQVQGFEALDAMKSLVYAPVSLAIQAEEIEKIASAINNGEIEEIEKAVIINAQSKVVCVKFKNPVAKRVLEESAKLGASAYPIGAESKYEVTPMFYRLSGTMIRENKEYEDYWIRINPMRSGSDTVLRILTESLKRVVECS